MSSNRRSNRNNQNDQRQDEINALNRLAAVLERLTNSPPVTTNYISVDTLTVLSPSETPPEPRTKEPKRKKSKTNKNNAVTEPTPSANPNYTYTTQQPPRQPPIRINTSKRTPTNTPQPTRKLYFGVNPLCVNCNFHHPTENPCRLCTKCNRLGHFATNCRSNPSPANTIVQTPQTITVRTCYECGDPNHRKNACPRLQTATASTVPNPQDQAPELFDTVMNS